MLLAFALLAPSMAAADGHSMQMDSDEMRMMDDALADLESSEGKEFEVAYVNQMVPHHQGALEMAQAVVDRASDRRVRDAAARIIEDQRREIEELTEFLREKYGREVQPDRRMAMDPSMIQRMNDVDPATAEKMFLLGMREHHEVAIRMGEIALRKAQSQEILVQADNMVSSQRAEQEGFARVARELHGISAPTPSGDMETAMRLAMGPEKRLPETSGPSLSVSAVLAAALAAPAFYAVRRVFSTGVDGRRG
ncbi:hypothetical protein RxyAA322_23290 [Rubrobacter xylanophilus]|uniref:DUF305 domain-containing protein n=1 Tax=Rubrobacter xylanophilus TaxID=49319 RepID=A0A510HMC8_9ACTN|nr:DUF305 domain-containing protein [Rubrobacter xylanophilus]BBL80475.1 hypothetical protein RxyAA322_23290 [Rubrobacter xylanophilus]